MKTLLLLVALNAISYSHAVPLGGVVSGGFVKQGGFAVGPAASHAEGYVDGSGGAVGGIGASGGAAFSASIGGGGGGGGEVVKTVTVEKHLVPASHGYINGAGSGGGGFGTSGGASFVASFGGIAKHGHHGHAEVVSEKILDVEAEAPPPPQPAKKTVIERTIIPNYVEKRIQVPTYVEKTIRVPTYVEKTIKVPAAPTILEKTISQEEVPAIATHKEVVPIVPPASDFDNVHVLHKVKVRPHKVYQKEIITSGGGGGAGYFGGADYGGFGGASGFGGGAGGVGGFRGHVSGGGAGLFDGIFNIPIQTLGAVNKFLNNLSGGISAEGSFSKGFATY